MRFSRSEPSAARLTGFAQELENEIEHMIRHHPQQEERLQALRRRLQDLYAKARARNHAAAAGKSLIDRKREEIEQGWTAKYPDDLVAIFGQRVGSLPPQLVPLAINNTRVIVHGLSDSTQRQQTRASVIAEVQSGKTTRCALLPLATLPHPLSSMMLAIGRAADCGYKFVILLAGTKVNLQRQTQSRFDEIVRDLESDTRWKTVSLTSVDKDIGKQLAGGLIAKARLAKDARDSIVVSVMKKNKSCLEALIQLLKDDTKLFPLRSTPCLVIDDECDEASINVTARGSLVHSLIVDLLALFSCCSYVGYTATPLAILLQDPKDDLFPKSVWLLKVVKKNVMH